MNIIRLISAALLLIITIPLSAQKHEKQEIVLNDGTCLVGTIVADSSGYLSVKIRKPQVITLNKSQIYSTGNVRAEVTGTDDKKGYSIRLSASMLAGRNSNGSLGSMGFHLSNGYQFRNGFSAGFGTGIDKLDILLMPVYTDLRFQPLKTRVSPFIWVKSGYSIPMSDRGIEDLYYFDYYREPKGGIMFSAGTGIALYSWRSNAVSIGMGYRYQKIRLRQKNIWNEESINELVTYFNRIEVQFGFIFR
jgi:hypothetical protein